MSRSRFFLVALVAVMLAALAVPFAAQDTGVAITVTTGAGPDTFSPIYCTGTDCADIVAYLYMSVFAVDPESGNIRGGQDSIVESFTTEDNIVYNVKLREDIFWSDGVQLTANDIMVHWELINTPEAEHPTSFILETVLDVEMVDDFNLNVTLASPACNGILQFGYMEPIPAHVFGGLTPDEIKALDANLNPQVVSGQFSFGQYRAAELTTLLTRPEYVDAGEINLDGFIQKVVPDQTVALEELLEGQINFLESIPANNQDEVREAANLQTYEFPGDTWDYLAFNLADPNNPQPALDADGNRIDQGLHPIFSDKMVRNAIGHAVDVDALIEGALFGNGTRMPAQITGSSWAFNEELAPRAYDVELASQMLEEAGWVDTDGDGVRECRGCLYSVEVDPAFEGSPMSFDLITNAGNTRREAIATIIQDQLADIGVQVNFSAIEFNALLEVMDAQTYDTLILGWRAGYPDVPDTIQLFGAAADVPGSGFNFTSFYNEEYFALEEAANTVPGCGQEERAAIYAEMQEIMYDEMPYLWLFSQNGMYAANVGVEGFAPFPQAIDWNITNWNVGPAVRAE